MISNSEPTRSGTPQGQSIIVTAIILFALSGLMVGFTVGAFVRPAKQPGNNANQSNLATTTSTAISTTPTPIITAVPLAPPNLTLTGTQTYTATIQAVDKNDTNKMVTADGITCRIWLVPQGNDPNNAPGTKLTADILAHPENFNQPFPQEVQNALVFSPSTVTETQPCMQGSATWTFTISPSVAKGEYFLVGLTDWKGKNYNWRWYNLTVDGNK